MPQSRFARLTERSRSPVSTNERTSLSRVSGRTAAGLSRYQSSSGSVYFDSRKKTFSSDFHSVGVPWSGQSLSSPSSSFSV